MNSSYIHVLNRICEEVQQEMGSKLKENQIEWTVNVEVLFFYSMIGHKPVGVNKHFMMVLIHQKFSNYLNAEIYSKVLWDHLDSMYDMAALHESEIIPFPNEETDYELPEECYELLQSKYAVNLKKFDSENELNKSTTNNSTIKSSKKILPKLKQNNAPANSPKSTFATPIASKLLKSQTVVKSEAKTPSTDVTPKVKSESGSFSKNNKIKHSSSPFATKLVKSEPASLVKEDSPDILSTKKNKSDRSSSPAVVKKPMKTESNVPINSAKKVMKTESSGNGSKTSKSESTESISKKIKQEKDQVGKKGKTALPVEVSTKKVKADNGVKKKSETESSSKKSSDSSSVKQIKTEAKSSSQSNKVQDLETSLPSGSRKSSPVAKVKTSDSSKKLKRPRTEESSKKSTPVSKRRRL